MSRIAFMLGEDFEDSEFRKPYDALRAAGHTIEVLGAKAGTTMKGKSGTEEVRIEAAAAERDPQQFDALVIPGGYSPDHLRTNRSVVDFVERMIKGGKLIAAVCHGPQLLIEARGVDGKKLTSFASVKTVSLLTSGSAWETRSSRGEDNAGEGRPDRMPARGGDLRRPSVRWE